MAQLGDKECDVKTLDNTHLYCEPPEEQPLALDDSDLPRLMVSLYLVSSLVVTLHMFFFLNITRSYFYSDAIVKYSLAECNMTSFEHHTVFPSEYSMN